jgi:5-methylcytosine-specific restriction endonuclease McrA
MNQEKLIKNRISDWQGRPLSLELHHIDGNRQNHLLDNLVILCPNCHSQTDTFRAKNKKI